MEIKRWEFGTTFDVTVIKSSKQLIAVHAPSTNEGFILMGHGVFPLPDIGQEGVITFTKGGPAGGYWKYENKDNALGGNIKPNKKQMENVTDKEQAREFFANEENAGKSITCENSKGETKECTSFTEAEAHFEQFTSGTAPNTDATVKTNEENAGNGENNANADAPGEQAAQ